MLSLVLELDVSSHRFRR